MRFLIPCLIIGSLALTSACQDRPSPTDGERPTVKSLVADDPDIRKDLEELAKGKDDNDLAGSVAADQARRRLTDRGGRIETIVIDTLRSANDWGVRKGCVEILTAIGGKDSIEHLIAVLDDSEPIVAFHADVALTAMLKVNQVSSRSVKGLAALPPLSEPDQHEANSSYRIWNEWHQRHGRELKRAWSEWWTANKGTVKVQ